jgi:hypothetical protein
VTARPRQRDGERGQGLVEFTMLFPVFILLLLAMLEFGFLFDHALTIQYASREGARMGSALVRGGSDLNDCSPGGWQTVDDNVIAAVTRVLESTGSRVRIADVAKIRIYKADSNGNQVGTYVNVWKYTPGAGPLIDGHQLDYSVESTGWPACTRNDADPTNGADSIGVSLTYTYSFQTALGSVLRFFGGSSVSSVSVSDRTVMALNPTD